MQYFPLVVEIYNPEDNQLYHLAPADRQKKTDEDFQGTFHYCFNYNRQLPAINPNLSWG